MCAEMIAHEVLNDKGSHFMNSSFSNGYGLSEVLGSYKNSKGQPIVYGIRKIKTRDFSSMVYQLVKLNWETGKAQIIKDFYRINSYFSSKYVFTDDEQEYENAIQVRKDRHYNELIENDKYLTSGLWRLTPNTPIYDKVYCSLEKKPKYGNPISIFMEHKCMINLHQNYLHSFSCYTEYEYRGNFKRVLRCSANWSSKFNNGHSANERER
jgi:hypothetical protein